MTEEQAINYIRAYCYTEDKETNHIEADKALYLFLLSLGYSKLVEEWEKVLK